jgi:hypothetical protein
VSSRRRYEPGYVGGFSKVSAEFPEVPVARSLAGELPLEDPFQQSAKLSQSRQLNMWRPPSEARVVRSGQETGRFTKADGISEFAEVVVWRGYGPVVHRVDEVEGRMPSYQHELMSPALSHSKSLSPSKAF